MITLFEKATGLPVQCNSDQYAIMRKNPNLCERVEDCKPQKKAAKKAAVESTEESE